MARNCHYHSTVTRKLRKSRPVTLYGLPVSDTDFGVFLTRSFIIFKVLEELIRINLRFSRSRAGAEYCVMLVVLFCVDRRNSVVIMSTEQYLLTVNHII